MITKKDRAHPPAWTRLFPKQNVRRAAEAEVPRGRPSAGTAGDNNPPRSCYTASITPAFYAGRKTATADEAAATFLE